MYTMLPKKNLMEGGLANDTFEGDGYPSNDPVFSVDLLAQISTCAKINPKVKDS